MKKTLLSLAAITALMTSCNTSLNLSGEIEGVESDTILIYISDAISGSWLKIDTVPLLDGDFETRVPDSIPISISLVGKNKYNVKQPVIIGQDFVLFPGEKMTISGKPPYGLRASGTTTYDLLNTDTAMTRQLEELGKVNEALDHVGNDEEREAQLEEEYDRIEAQLNTTRINFIQTHPNTNAAALLLQYFDGEEGLEAIDLLADETRNGILKPRIDEMEMYCKEAVETKKRQQFIQPGMCAPNFQLNDIDGKTRSLTDFRGKYAVLDFWGTWCGWCLAGIPKMKEYYQKYADQVEFVGICCEDRKDRWTNCVKQKEMTWTQLFNEETDHLPITYGVDGYPTKIILDPEGKIVKVFDGESDDFYEMLDELFQ